MPRDGARRADEEPEVWITGLGLVSSLGEGGEAHWEGLGGAGRSHVQPRVDDIRFAPYPVHPLAGVDFSMQIPSKADLRQMGPWQSLGTYAAGLALADAGVLGPEMRASTHLNVAAGNGERDAAADRAVLEALSASAAHVPGDCGAVLNEALQRALRPTLYLAELSNLLAGSISIVHGVTASSRTFKGEEMAGVSAMDDAVKRIRAGTSDLFLVGGACNAERADLMLNLELCGAMWRGQHRPVWERAGSGGGIVLGSVGAFLVLESGAHARARGKRPYSGIAGIASARLDATCNAAVTRQTADSLLERLCPDGAAGPLPMLSGASGAEPATTLERCWLADLKRRRGIEPCVRAFGTMLGHALEAHFFAGVALAALALSKGSFFAPFDESGQETATAAPMDRVLMTGWGHWRGAGLGLLVAAGRE